MASLGGFTSVDAASYGPAIAGSLSPGGKSMEVRFMASAIASSTRLTTNSPVDMDVARGVLGRAVGVVLQAEHDQRRILRETLKNENGAALTTPSGLKVVTSAIGRGTTRPHSSL